MQSQVRNLPDVRVLSDFGPSGVSLPPGHSAEVLVEVTPRNYGIICTLLMLDFGEPATALLCTSALNAHWMDFTCWQRYLQHVRCQLPDNMPEPQ